jgi:ABC-type lipoprotein release transport system permease subunit
MFLNIVKRALRALWRNAMRSFLTILGMVLGVAAVIAIVSIERGASVAVQERIGTMGTHLLIVLSGSTTQAGVRSSSGGRPTLTRRDAQAIQRECPAVRTVTYTNRQVLQRIAGSQNWSTAVSGVTADYAIVRDWPIATGRFLSQQDEESAATSAVLGTTVRLNTARRGDVVVAKGDDHDGTACARPH